MAQIRLLSWNIEVYGPNKYGNVPNNLRIVEFIVRTVRQQNANIVVLQELMSSIAGQICWSLADGLKQVTGNDWMHGTIPARPNGDRESYGILWQSGGAPGFTLTSDANGQGNVALSPLEFPNGFSSINGRRAAVATFRTTDTAVNFAVSVWHSVPGNPVPGLEQIAKTPALYAVDNAGAQQLVAGRLLAGDFNMAVTQPQFAWFTNPMPPAPPPVAPGQGAGTTSILPADAAAYFTHYAKIADAVREWGANLANWSGVPRQYRDYQLDGSYYASPNGAPAPGGGVVDLVADIMLPASPLRAVAQTFTLNYPGTPHPAFPNAGVIPLPLNINLNTAACAFLLYRYGISDHLPVLNSVTI